MAIQNTNQNYLQDYNARQLSRRGASSYGRSNTHVQTNTITTHTIQNNSCDIKK